MLYLFLKKKEAFLVYYRLYGISFRNQKWRQGGNLVINNCRVVAGRKQRQELMTELIRGQGLSKICVIYWNKKTRKQLHNSTTHIQITQFRPS